jgi:hypothetical protein
MESQDEESLCLTDHKSRDLKERSKRRKTKSDEKLDEFLRQLYIYCIPLHEKYKKYPDYLEFNCFRTGVFIREKFDIAEFEKTKQWATERINEITFNNEWESNFDYWFCKNLCDVSGSCYVMELNEGG